MTVERLNYLINCLYRELEVLRRLRGEINDDYDTHQKIFVYDVSFLNELKDEVEIKWV